MRSVQYFVFASILGLASWVSATPDLIRNHISSVCSESIEVREGHYGKEFSVVPTQMASLDGVFVTANQVFHEGQEQVKFSVLKSGKTETYYLAVPYFRRVLLTETAVWFLLDDALLEFDLSQKKLTGAFPSFPQRFEMGLSTRARGFTYAAGFIYIAHGELGISVFNAKTHQHYTVLRGGIQPGSLAAAVQVQGSDLYVLQGAFQQNGFNGVAYLNLQSGSTKLIAYSEQAGVVDPYNSTMRLTQQNLLINNSGWIHGLSLAGLRKGISPQRPVWLQVSEKLETAAGVFDRFLMIDGDFILSEGEALACSSVHYVPVGQKRPIREWRFIQRKI